MSFWPALLVAAIVGAAPAAPGQLTLAIVDQNGLTLPGVEVAVTGPVTHQSKTDGNGVTVFPDLPAGSYRLSTRTLGFVSESREVIIRAGVAADLKIEFRLDWPIEPQSGKPIRNTISVRCDGPASHSIEKSWRAADAVARIQIYDQAVYDHWMRREDGFPIVTVHHARVAELFKPHPRLPMSARTVTLLQEGGIVERADLIEKASPSGSKLLDAHREYVVFLRWSDQWAEWSIAGCDLGTIEVAGEADEPLATLRTIKD